MNLARFIAQHGLPAAYADSAERFFLPLARWLVSRLRAHGGQTFVLGINGAQGTGKSTLADLLCVALTSDDHYRIAILSIDDIYLTRAERDALGSSKHSLLRTRGVPGTHDVALGIAVIEQLKTLRAGESCTVPRFDKSQDDRCPQHAWTTVTGPIDLVIFEGWCVGSQPQDAAALATPSNALERDADADGRWRAYVNAQLAGAYRELFALLDALVFLRAPNFEAVARWRTEQEHALRERAGAAGTAVMSDDAVRAFIQNYERITRNNIEVLPGIADVVIELDDAHRATAMRTRESA